MKVTIDAAAPVAFLVPGQGADPRGAVSGLYRNASHLQPVIDEVLDDIRAASGSTGEQVRAALLDGRADAPVESGVPQLANYTISVLLARLLALTGIRPQLVMGQSFGEIAALVCAGALDVGDGARAVCALNSAFREVEGSGAMVLVEASDHDTLRLLDDHPELVLACVNSPRQTIVSGPIDAITTLLAQAEGGPRLFRLPIPYASHHPGLVSVAEQFRAGLSEVALRPLQVQIYSPVARRDYTDAQDLRAALADCVIKPVDLPAALLHLESLGPWLFVELGLGQTVSRCVRATIPQARTWAPLSDDLSWLADIAVGQRK
jgi:acyl transferase domain-containing protein